MKAVKTAITVTDVAYHRNGVSGEGFHVVLFTDPGAIAEGAGATGEMVAIVFPGQGRVAVLDRNLTAQGNVAFAAGNSWRGDHYEAELRAAIKQDGA